MATSLSVGREDWTVDKGKVCFGEGTTEEPTVSRTLAGSGEDRGERWEEEHSFCQYGQGDAGVSKLWHPLGRGHLPRVETSEEDEER